MQTLNKIPVTDEIVEDTDIVETFKQQLAEGLYKIWPTKPLEPGEYALVEYTEGKANIQVWDFSVTKIRERPSMPRIVGDCNSHVTALVHLKQNK